MTNNIISNIVDDKQLIKNQLGDTPSVIPATKRFSNNFYPQRIALKIYSNDITGAMIWGHSSYGVWGTSTWGGTIISDLYAVLPHNNIFIEYFCQDTFIDTSNSTGVLDTTYNTYTLTSGDVLQSNIIAKLRTPIKNVKFSCNDLIVEEGGMKLGYLELGITTFNDNNINLYLSNDGGTTWYYVEDISDIFTFPQSTNNDELMYKIKAISDITIDSSIVIEINK